MAATGLGSRSGRVKAANWLKPVKIIKDKVEEFVVKVNGRYCIGFHIRRTDNLSSINQSPDIVFEKAIDDEFFKFEFTNASLKEGNIMANVRISKK